jgi:hypothetical protein
MPETSFTSALDGFSHLECFTDGETDAGNQWIEGCIGLVGVGDAKYREMESRYFSM